MPEYLAPGVYLEESDFGVKPIAGVSTSTIDIETARALVAAIESIIERTQPNSGRAPTTLIRHHADRTLRVGRRGLALSIGRLFRETAKCGAGRGGGRGGTRRCLRDRARTLEATELLHRTPPRCRNVPVRAGVPPRKASAPQPQAARIRDRVRPRSASQRDRWFGRRLRRRRGGRCDRSSRRGACSIRMRTIGIAGRWRRDVRIASLLGPSLRGSALAGHPGDQLHRGGLRHRDRARRFAAGIGDRATHPLGRSLDRRSRVCQGARQIHLDFSERLSIRRSRVADSFFGIPTIKYLAGKS